MEMHLQPLATTCYVSGEPFVEGVRVASFLVRKRCIKQANALLLKVGARQFRSFIFIGGLYGKAIRVTQL